MREEINLKTENLKKMLNSVDDVLQNWNDIRKETEIQLEEKATYLQA